MSRSAAVCSGILVLMLVAFPPSVRSEEPTSRADELNEAVEDYLTDYLAGREFPCAEHSFLARGEMWSVRFGDEAKLDCIFGFATGKKDRLQDRYWMSAWERATRPKREWEQQMWIGDEVLFRYGYDPIKSQTNLSTRLKPDKTKEKQRIKEIRGFPHIDPYFLPVAEHGSVTVPSIGVDKDYALKWFLLNGRLLGSEVDRGGNSVGVWRIGGKTGSVVDVTFSSEGKLPIRTVWRRVIGDDVDLAGRDKLPVFSVCVTKWQQISCGGETISVPSSVELAGVEPKSGVPWENTKVHVRWRFGETAAYEFGDIEILEMSRELELDWREPLRSLYEEDWLIDFEEFTATRTDPR